jgi:hypothetical protein
VKGVGRTREELKQKRSCDLEAFDTHLRIETDQSHKELIKQRRLALGV